MTTFLYPVVKNLSIAARRKRTRMASTDAVESPEPTANESDDPKQQRSELELMLASLPETHREVLLMRFVDGMSLQEIGQAMDIPEGTVKSRIHNAIATLRSDDRVKRYFEPPK
jgi:RNA polymerase sigma-70 factor (ECF subfamily)